MIPCSMMRALSSESRLEGMAAIVNKDLFPRRDCGNLSQAPGSVHRVANKTKHKLSS
jgi:hypothetical protein